MMLDEITAKAGSHKRRKRVGRGESSGFGKTSTRGHKGVQARSGGGMRPLHEGGQMPIFRRLPKRGFNNVKFARLTEHVNLDRIDKRFNDGDTVNIDTLRTARLVMQTGSIVKVLARGTLTKKLTVEAHEFSAKAKELIEKAGGTAKIIELKTPAEKAKAKRGTKKATKPKPAKPAPAPQAEAPTEPKAESQPEQAPPKADNQESSAE